jgi:hypothetical protein
MKILRVVGSKALDCGCFVGLYELYSGQVITVIDCQGERCDTSWHVVDTKVPAAPMTLGCRPGTHAERPRTRPSD